MLNTGDAGLLASLDKLAAADASHATKAVQAAATIGAAGLLGRTVAGRSNRSHEQTNGRSNDRGARAARA